MCIHACVRVHACVCVCATHASLQCELGGSRWRRIEEHELRRNNATDRSNAPHHVSCTCGLRCAVYCTACAERLATQHTHPSCAAQDAPHAQPTVPHAIAQWRSHSARQRLAGIPAKCLSEEARSGTLPSRTRAPRAHRSSDARDSRRASAAVRGARGQQDDAAAAASTARLH